MVPPKTSPKSLKRIILKQRGISKACYNKYCMFAVWSMFICCCTEAFNAFLTVSPCSEEPETELGSTELGSELAML